MKSPYCSVCQKIVEAVSYIPLGIGENGEMEYSEIGIVINTEGSSAFRWADGTIGTSKEQDDLANEDEQPQCIHCGSVVEWATTHIVETLERN